MGKEIQKENQQVVGIIGVGLDDKDGHKRITRNDSVVILGGSEETHEHMQSVSIRFNESLKERGKELQEAEVEEVIDLLHRAFEN